MRDRMLYRLLLAVMLVVATVSGAGLAESPASLAQTIPGFTPTLIPTPACDNCIYMPLVALNPTPTPEPTPTPTFVPVPTGTPVPERRLGTWVEDMNLSIKAIEVRHDNPPDNGYTYVVRDLFTTRDGSWEVSGKFGSIDAWARYTYLHPRFDDAGADHHLFGALLDEYGNLILGVAVPLQFWSDGFHKLSDPTYDNYVYADTKPHSGWGNIVMFNSSYVPEPPRNESGPWCWTIRNAEAEVVCGGGMPANQHISTFAVWQMVRKP